MNSSRKATGSRLINRRCEWTLKMTESSVSPNVHTIVKRYNRITAVKENNSLQHENKKSVSKSSGLRAVSIRGSLWVTQMTNYLLSLPSMAQQESIPVGCVSSAFVVPGGWCLPTPSFLWDHTLSPPPPADETSPRDQTPREQIDRHV